MAHRTIRSYKEVSPVQWLTKGSAATWRLSQKRSKLKRIRMILCSTWRGTLQVKLSKLNTSRNALGSTSTVQAPALWIQNRTNKKLTREDKEFQVLARGSTPIREAIRPVLTIKCKMLKFINLICLPTQILKSHWVLNNPPSSTSTLKISEARRSQVARATWIKTIKGRTLGLCLARILLFRITSPSGPWAGATDHRSKLTNSIPRTAQNDHKSKLKTEKTRVVLKAGTLKLWIRSRRRERMKKEMKMVES